MLLSFKYVPETKGKTIEEIADQFSPGGNVTVAVDIIDPAAATEVDEGHLSAAAGDDNFTESSVDGIEMQEKAGEEQSMFFWEWWDGTNRNNTRVKYTRVKYTRVVWNKHVWNIYTCEIYTCGIYTCGVK